MFKGLANAVRFLAIDQVGAARSGHLGAALGMSDCLTALFKNILVFDPANPRWPNRDRFIMSGGHGSAALYALLHLCGYHEYSIKELKNFRQINSITSGHPEYNPALGIEISTGPLGQGLANAVGMALEERILNARLGDDCINHYTYVSVGEGDLMEGISHEACSLAGNLSLGHLIVLFDKNDVTIDGHIDVCYSDDVMLRFKSYGWHVVEANGHNEEEITEALSVAKQNRRPSLVICNTKIGYGTPREGMPKAHSGALTAEERAYACQYFEWDCDPFKIPEYISKSWAAIGSRHHTTCKQWIDSQSKKYEVIDFDIAEKTEHALRRVKKDCFVSRPFEATRTSTKNILDKISSNDPLFISGSCDLGGSCGCKSSNMRPLTKDDFSGNYIHYGIREHAMGAIINGLVADGKLKACGGTFLAFSDYMRPAIRMSALMNIPSIFVFSHDSIGVGEDGPTHQPIEHLASLRAIPNLNVFRPADTMETVECWELALNSKTRPSIIVLTRQDVLSTRFSDRCNLCASGAYLLNNEENAKYTIIASGSEVGIALELKKMLTDAGISGNVVSMPCCALFDDQSNEYRNQVLGQSFRIGIEASNGFGLQKYLGDNSLFFGVQEFGKSAPAKDVFDHFHLNAKDIFEKVICTLKED
ncbi:MAG: transketolase [Alphaproteobacteria bacterium]|nr:transketolase [Alphaproteobacteria bacterium]